MLLSRRARLSSWLCAVVLASGCARQPTAAPASSEQKPAVPPPLPAAAPAALPALERARLEYLFAAAALVTQTWPQLSAAETCILLLAQEAQWVVNCSEAPAGFARTHELFREQPVFAHAGGGFAVAAEQRSTQQLLSQTPAAAHVFAPGSQHADLPAAHPWLLLGTLDALRAFHPAFGPATTESWLSVAMHELVHIHQLRQPAFASYLARIDSHALEPSALGELFASDPEFRVRIEREYSQLVAAAEHALDPKAAARALREWLVSYRVRSRQRSQRPEGARLLEAERVFTYLEGVARFVESDFLANTAQHPQSAPHADPQFHAFAEFVGHGYRASPNRQLDTQYYYAIGYHLCVLLERVDPSWKQRVHLEPGWLIDVVERLAAPKR